eukprot:403356136
MSIQLDKRALENIKNYQYKTNGLTYIETHFYEYFWNFILSLLPRSLAPNMMTLLGLVFPLIHFFILLYYDWTFTATLPNWVHLHAVWMVLWYQTIDAVDGKQARKTDNCSSLGQLLDHNLDQISYTIIFLNVCATCKTGSNWFLIFLVMPPIFTPHYSIEFRKHFTKIHVTVVGAFGATESMTIMMTGFFGAFLAYNSNDFYQIVFELIGIKFTIGQLILWGSFISGVHYNLENIYYGFKGSSSTYRAFMTLFPYIQLYIISIILNLHRRFIKYFINSRDKIPRTLYRTISFCDIIVL